MASCFTPLHTHTQTHTRQYTHRRSWLLLTAPCHCQRATWATPCKAALTRCGRRRIGRAAGGMATARRNSAHCKQNLITRPYPTPYTPQGSKSIQDPPKNSNFLPAISLFIQQDLHKDAWCVCVCVCMCVMEHWQLPYWNLQKVFFAILTTFNTECSLY